MASREFHFGKWSLVKGDIKVDVNLSRFEKQFQRAQYELDGDVMNSMVPFMPMITGSFINTTKAASAAVQGSGQVYAAFGPQGRYLYEGKAMVDSATGKGPMRIEESPGQYIFRYRKGATLKATDRPLRYTKTAHAEAQNHWFDVAKERDDDKWIEKAKKTAGGG